MSMPRPFSTNFAETYTAASLTDGLNGFIVASDGTPYVLGAVVPSEEVQVDKRLYAVDSSGDVIQASKVQGKPYSAGATDVEVFQYGNAGQSEWILVYATEAISAGRPCSIDLTSPPTGFAVGDKLVEMANAGKAPGQVVGVAQHNIAINTYGWILRKGKGKVYTLAAGVTAGVGAIVSVTDHEAGDAAAVTDATFGYFLEDNGSAGLTLAWLDCRG